ncbi:MAG: spore germination protein [Bacillota bacterium]|nr:spore germination protein [Bacillota bacterium]
MASERFAPLRREVTRLHQLSDLANEAASLELSLLWELSRHRRLSGHPDLDARLIRTLMGGRGHLTADYAERTVRLPGRGRGRLIWLSSMVETKILDSQIFGAISRAHVEGHAAEAKPVKAVDEAVRLLGEGRVLLLMPGQPPALALAARGYEHRQVGDPQKETSMRGSREAFVEDLATNVSLVRRRVLDPRLRVEPFVLGEFRATEVRLLWIQGLTHDPLVNEMRRRLRSIRLPQILDVRYIEELAADDPYTIFPTALFTERPDTVAAALNEGRLAVLVEGSPDALVLPVTFWSFLQAADDYYSSYWIASFLRLLRIGLALLALVFPALYIAVIVFHPEMLPGILAFYLARTRVSVPFPAVVEAFLMELAFETLREAGTHLPPKLSTSLSVVGALVIGQAVVSSGLVSWPMVVVVSVTAIANFALPSWEMATSVRLLRFALMVLAALFGVPGVLVGLALILGHLCGLRSLGIPYLAPLAPLTPHGLGDTLLRLPHWVPGRRPRLLEPYWKVEVPRGQRPHPPAGAGTFHSPR